MQPRIYFAFMAARALYCLVLSLLLFRTPTAFPAELPPGTQTWGGCSAAWHCSVPSAGVYISFWYTTYSSCLSVPAAEVSLNHGLSFKSICISFRFGCHVPTWWGYIQSHHPSLLPLLGLSCLPNQQQCYLCISVPTCCALSFLFHCNCKTNKAKKGDNPQIFLLLSLSKTWPAKILCFPIVSFFSEWFQRPLRVKALS